ncbi:rhodanese-related sulfurtransferase [Kineococcus xinjiangensis]|uniref:Rhodanese-related sulfurtransferase n=1 Tax=Kineococcus xinjiangensis TaxID=512762 RepID=A0A2S6IDW8_9ACTN|nr:rhodanese-like domain-containing protein [Kineococcus xinjiangensis]PPK92360.1 rhodanese-related sulfurtransferase [Kineococcus xinjiangensis]
MADLPSVPAALVPAGVVVLDVREDDEWAAGHIDGALHIPMGQVPQRVQELPADDELHVICRSGGRSARVVAWLQENGYDAVNVAGGMGAWADAGRPMVADDGREPGVL